jgi:hypothetical protein
MSEFLLTFTHEATCFDEPSLNGKIIIDDFSEGFISPLTYWSKQDYLQSWVFEITKANKISNKAFLATSMYDPQFANFIFGWALYFRNDLVFCQNHILFLNEISGEFNPLLISSYMHEREIENEEGQKISEWQTTRSAVMSFIKSIDNAAGKNSCSNIRL